MDSPFHSFDQQEPPSPPKPFYNTFLERGREGKNEWWRYLVGVLLTFFAGYSIVGAIPLLVIALAHHSAFELQNQELLEDPAFMQVSSNVLLAALLFIFVAAMFFLWIAVRFVHKKRFLSIINSEGARFDFRRFFLAVGVWFLLSMILMAVSYFSAPENFKLVFEPGPFIGTLIICLVMLPVQTSWEELFLRGYLLQGLGLWLKRPVWPWLITSVTFGLLHMANAEVKAHGIAEMLPQYIAPGLLFGLIAVLDERLELALGLHFANNFFSILAVTSPDMSIQANSIWQTSSIGGFSDFLVGLVPMLLVIGLFWWKYKWNLSKLTRAY
jgi:hypothetical protein